MPSDAGVRRGLVAQSETAQSSRLALFAQEPRPSALPASYSALPPVAHCRRSQSGQSVAFGKKLAAGAGAFDACQSEAAALLTTNATDTRNYGF